MSSLPDSSTPAKSTEGRAGTETLGDPVPVPPPEMCVECIDPVTGDHFFTTVGQCQALGGTIFGNPFPCPVTTAERQELFARVPENN